ncbi:hypothetical protein ACJJI5_10145 [Microbulbifer sp. EKSA008]|uniref:hypothetical protein n=1 Tax=Microbulbifer sp. EKSA008 TaxID=3243367 RepID=UPI004041044A
MNIKARIEKIENTEYESFVILDESNIPSISSISLFNPEQKRISIGEHIDCPVRICFVRDVLSKELSSPQYLRQVKNTTEACGIVQSVDSDGDFICDIKGVGSIPVELEENIELSVGSAVSFKGELRAEI